MILVDTSVWINHLRAGNRSLIELLEAGAVLTHPFVVGELALGNLRQRHMVLRDVSNLPHVVIVSDLEVLDFVERFALFGRGVGYIDCHLLAAVRLTAGAQFWTHDKSLKLLAEQIGVAKTVNA